MYQMRVKSQKKIKNIRQAIIISIGLHHHLEDGRICIKKGFIAISFVSDIICMKTTIDINTRSESQEYSPQDRPSLST